MQDQTEKKRVGRKICGFLNSSVRLLQLCFVYTNRSQEEVRHKKMGEALWEASRDAESLNVGLFLEMQCSCCTVKPQFLPGADLG